MITDEQWAIKATPENLKLFFQDKINWKLFNYLDVSLISKKDSNDYYKLSACVFFSGTKRLNLTFYDIFTTSSENEDIGTYNDTLSNRAMIEFERMYQTNGMSYDIKLDYGNVYNNLVLDKIRRIVNKYDLDINVGDYWVRIVNKI